MTGQLRRLGTFPSVSLASHSWGLPVEVALTAQPGVGGGDASSLYGFAVGTSGIPSTGMPMAGQAEHCNV